jgi:hypothetical protein
MAPFKADIYKYFNQFADGPNGMNQKVPLTVKDLRVSGFRV